MTPFETELIGLLSQLVTIAGSVSAVWAFVYVLKAFTRGR